MRKNNQPEQFNFVLFIRVFKIQCKRVFGMSWKMSLKVYLEVYLKIYLSILFSVKFEVKELDFESQSGSESTILEEASNSLCPEALLFSVREPERTFLTDLSVALSTPTGL